MDSAKNAVKTFLGQHGKQETDVHTTTAPAVTDETVVKTQEERATTAIDKEVHQDHHHTTVQPISDTARKDEQHHHKMAGVQERRADHDDADRVKEQLAAEQAKYRDTSRVVEGEHTTTGAPSVVGEHVHHHVHETVQPVIQRETIEPHITHTTIPVHEVHHNASKHHATSTLPPVSREEFESNGGTFAGKEQHKTFQGEPRLANQAEVSK